MNEKTHKGLTALTNAATHSQYTCLEMLLQAGADVNATDMRASHL